MMGRCKFFHGKILPFPSLVSVYGLPKESAKRNHTWRVYHESCLKEERRRSSAKSQYFIRHKAEWLVLKFVYRCANRILSPSPLIGYFIFKILDRKYLDCPVNNLDFPLREKMLSAPVTSSSSHEVGGN